MNNEIPKGFVEVDGYIINEDREKTIFFIKHFLAIGIASILLLGSILYAAAVTSSPWDGTGWNTSAPNDEALVGNTYKEICDLRKGVEMRANREHLTYASSSVGGWHLNGSAVCYEGTTAEPNLPDDSAALSNIARDRGRLWVDDNYDPPALKRWDGTAYEVVGTIATGSAPQAYLTSDANENTDGGRESQIIFRATKEDDTPHELVTIQGSHDGTGDDYKADVIVLLNDGDDANGSLTEVFRIDSAKLATFAGAVTVTGVLTPSDALTMASGKTATIEIIQAVDATGILLKSDAGTTVVTIEDSNVATLADSSQLATAAAPTDPCDIANMQYVDDTEGAGTGYYDPNGATVFNAAMTSANTFQDLNLSAHVGSNSALVFLEVTSNAVAQYAVKPKGQGSATWTKHIQTATGYDYGCCSFHPQASGDYSYMTVATDSSGVVQHGANNNTTTWTIKLIGYVK